MFKCMCCGEDVIYCGLPVAHFGRVLPLQNQQDHARHGCGGGGLALAQEKFIVPLFDGKTILCIDVAVN
jgi:hypothetical protein